MKELHIENNALRGTLCFDHLPWEMVTVNVSDNRFAESFVVRRIPGSLVNIYAAGNQLEGTAVVALRCRPYFELRENAISAIVDTEGKNAEGHHMF